MQESPQELHSCAAVGGPCAVAARHLLAHAVNTDRQTWHGAGRQAHSEAEARAVVVVATGVEIEHTVGNAIAVGHGDVVAELAQGRVRVASTPQTHAVSGQDAAQVFKGEEAWPGDCSLDLRAVMVGRIPITIGRVEAANPNRQLVAEEIPKLHALKVGSNATLGGYLKSKFNQALDLRTELWCQVQVKRAKAVA